MASNFLVVGTLLVFVYSKRPVDTNGCSDDSGRFVMMDADHLAPNICGKLMTYNFILVYGPSQTGLVLRSIRPLSCDKFESTAQKQIQELEGTPTSA